MAGPEDSDQAREEVDKAKDYFSKIPGFEAPSFEKPAPEEEEKPASEEWVPPTRNKVLLSLGPRHTFGGKKSQVRPNALSQSLQQ